MNKLLLIATFFLSYLIKAQSPVPQGINYQAVIRNSSGAIATNSIVSLKFTFYNSSTTLTSPVFNEVHTGLNTGTVGIVTCTIGMGTPNFGAFSNITWNNGDVWYLVSLKMGSSTTFSPIGNAQAFMTVPYAFYAGMAPTTLSVSPASGGTNLYSVGGNSVFIAAITSTASSASSTITGQGIAVVSPTIGNVFAVNVPTPALIYNTSSHVLTLNQGSATTSQTLTSAVNSTVSMLGVGVASINPNSGSSFTVTVPNPTLSLTGNIISLKQGTVNTSITLPTNSIIINGSGGITVSPTTPSTVFTISSSAVNNWSVTGSNLYPTNFNNNVGIGINSPTNKLDVVTTGSALIGLGVSSDVQAATFVTTAGGAHGIASNHLGTGNSIYGVKSASSTGIAGKFENKNSNNTFPALHAITNSTLALEVEGHIKSTQTTAPLVNINGSGTSTVLSAFSTSCTNCSDVKGNVTLYDVTSNTLTINPGNSITVRIAFNKPYSFEPVVNISQNSFAPYFYSFISTLTNSFFEVTYTSIYFTNFNITSNKFFKFNYMVIE